MRFLKYVLTTLSMLPITAQADTWLCIGEQATSVVQTADGKVGKSNASKAWENHKWIINENGVRQFDSKTIEMDQCVFKESGTVVCTDPSFVPSQFFLTKAGVFRLTTMLVDDSDNHLHLMVIGRCSKID